MSVAKITDKGYEVIFKKNAAYILDESRQIITTADRKGDLYFIRESSEYASVAKQSWKSNLMEWHERLGHLNERSLKEMAERKTVLGLKLEKDKTLGICEVCIKGKQTQTPFPRSRPKRTSELLEIVYTDVCGPMRTTSLGGAKYFAVFIDDKSRWCEIYFLSKKTDILDAFKQYKAYVENLTGKRIKALQSDNGTEYCNRKFDEFLRENGIRRRLTVPHTPEQNGVAERKNRTLVDMARCMLIQSKLPRSFWAEAVAAANYIRNRCCSRTLNGETAFKLWTGKRPTVSHCRSFGARALVYDKTPQKEKFQSRSKECILVGYSEESKAYRLWSVNERKIIRSRDVKFIDEFRPTEYYEKFVPERQLTSESEIFEQGEETVQEKFKEIEFDISLENTESNDNVEETASVPQMKIGPGRPRIVRTGNPGRPRKEPNLIPVEVEVDREVSEEQYVNLIESSNHIDIEKALKGPNAEKWRDAILEEYNAHISNNT